MSLRMQTQGAIVCGYCRNIARIIPASDLVFVAANDNPPSADAWDDDVPSGLLTLY